jgi:hypothetical protein
MALCTYRTRAPVLDLTVNNTRLTISGEGDRDATVFWPKELSSELSHGREPLASPQSVILRAKETWAKSE